MSIRIYVCTYICNPTLLTTAPPTPSKGQVKFWPMVMHDTNQALWSCVTHYHGNNSKIFCMALLTPHPVTSWRLEAANCPATQAAQPCLLVSPERREAAKEACDPLLKAAPFAACHGHVGPGPAYESCLAAVCACREAVPSCLCPVLAAYGDRCRSKV
jgi:hypothetical protein